MPVFNNALAGAAGSGGDAGYKIERSLRFNDDDSSFLNFSPSTSGTTGAHTHWTFSAWVKRTKLGVANQPIFGAMNGSNREGFIAFNSDDTLRFSETGPSSSSYHVDLHTSQKFRDTSAWYHIVVVYAYNQYTFDKARIYVNGVEVTQFGTKTITGGLYDESYINTASAPHYIGKYVNYSNSATYGDMYLANVHFVAGYTVPVSTDDDNGSVTGIPNAKYITEFGEFSSDTGVWIPKEYKGTYPRDGGFHLDFSDNSSNAALGTDSSGNNNTWTVNNLSVAAGADNDSLIDTPTNYSVNSGNPGGNYCTLNPLYKADPGNGTAKNGNLVWGGTTNNHHVIAGTFAVSSGKWYWEATYTNASSNYVAIGMCKVGHSFVHPQYTSVVPGYTENTAFSMTNSNGSYYYDSGTLSSYGTGWTTGDVIGVRYDEGAVYFYKNGTIMNANPILTLTGSWMPVFHCYDSGEWTVNFGQRSFAYTPPSNHLALCTTNLDDPLIADGSTAFDVLTWEGQSGSGSRDFRGLSFTPDLAWVKTRSVGYTHVLWDSVRGPGVNKELQTDNTNQEGQANTAVSGYIDAFVDGGFDTTAGTTDNDYFNRQSTTYVAWAWDGGDLATNSAYDQSKVWSSFWSATNNGIEPANPAANSFDGVLTGLGMRLNASSSCTWAPTGGYSYTGNFLIYCCKDNDYTGVSWTCVHAGGTTDFTSSVAAGTTQTAVNLTSLNVQSPITSISFTSNNNSNPRVSGMSANGKILVDAGVIPAGGLNSSAYTQDATYAASSNFSGSTTNVNFNYMFNGIIGSETVSGAIAFSQYGNNLEMTWTAPSTINNITSLRVYVDFSGTGTDGAFEVNGTSYRSHAQTTLGAGNDGWVTISETSLSSIKFGRNSNNTTAVGVGAVEVNGKILIDSSLTPPNVPSIASTVRANPTAGFSIVSYTGNGTSGSTVGHGLNGGVPKMVIMKNRDTASTDWRVYNTMADGSLDILYLNSSVNKSNSSLATHTGNVFTVGSSASTNENNSNFIAYCFAPVEGYSAFGSYTGNGSSDGAFVYTGFRPAWIMVKRTDSSAGNWTILDSARNTYNVANELLFPNLSDTTSFSSTNPVDLISNGFKLRGAGGNTNASNETYVYAAFAEHPFKTARAR